MKTVLATILASLTLGNGITYASTKSTSKNIVDVIQAVDIVQCTTTVSKDDEFIVDFEVNHVVPRVDFEFSEISILAGIFKPDLEFPEWLQNSTVGSVNFNPITTDSTGDNDAFSLNYFLTVHNGIPYQTSCVHFGEYESVEECDSIVAEIEPGAPGSLWEETQFDDSGYPEYIAELGPYTASIERDGVTLDVECFNEENNVSIDLDEEE